MRRIVNSLVLALVALLTVLAIHDLVTDLLAPPKAALILVLDPGSDAADQTAYLLRHESAKFRDLPLIIKSMNDYPKLKASDMPVVMLQIGQFPHIASPFMVAALGVDVAGQGDVTYMVKNFQLSSVAQANQYFSGRAAIANSELDTLDQMRASDDKIDDSTRPIDQMRFDFGNSAAGLMNGLKSRLYSTSNKEECQATAIELNRLEVAYDTTFNLLNRQAEAAVADLLVLDGQIHQSLERDIELDNGLPLHFYGPSTIHYVDATPYIWRCPLK